jgi:DNA invertase Pin-like site-specific DNA recombinase
MPDRIGYARVSTADQNPELQIDTLRAAGCSRIFTDYVSGTKTSRPQLDRAFDHLRLGDTLVVWKLDRLGRSLPHLVETVKNLAERNVGFRSLQDPVDTTTAGGRLVFHIFAALAEFERDLIRERTYAGLAAARARGRVGGRKRALTSAQVEMARELLADRQRNVASVAATFGVNRATLYRALRSAQATPDR